MKHSAGARESVEILDRMLYSFELPAASSTEQDRAKTSKFCVLLGKMSDSFDQDLQVEE